MIDTTTRAPKGILQTDQEFVHLGTRGIASKSSWLHHLVNQLPLVYEREGQWHYLPLAYRLMNQQKTEVETLVPIAIDQGNGFLKLAGQRLDHHLDCIVLPSRIEVVEEQVLHGARNRSTWRVGTPTGIVPTRVRVGDDAEGKKARGFAVGQTSERFEDDMYAMMLKIAMVQLLKHLGYRPGSHQLAVGLALRIPEISTDEQGKQLVDPVVSKALRQQVKGTFVVEETVGRARETWTITVARVFPTTQTIGSYFLWNFNLLCDPAQEKFRAVRVLDTGTGDLGEAMAQKRPGKSLVIEGHVVSEGAVQLAAAVSEAMRKHFASTRYSVARAQQSILDNALEVGGQAYPLILPEDLLAEEDPVEALAEAEEEEEPEETPTVQMRAVDPKRDAAFNINTHLKVQDVRRSYQEAIEQLLVECNPYLQDQSAFLIVTGGTLLNPLFAKKLERRIRTQGRTFSDSLTMPAEQGFAVKANALGTYVYTCWQIKRMLSEQG